MMKVFFRSWPTPDGVPTETVSSSVLLGVAGLSARGGRCQDIRTSSPKALGTAAAALGAGGAAGSEVDLDPEGDIPRGPPMYHGPSV